MSYCSRPAVAKQATRVRAGGARAARVDEQRAELRSLGRALAPQGERDGRIGRIGVVERREYLGALGAVGAAAAQASLLAGVAGQVVAGQPVTSRARSG